MHVEQLVVTVALQALQTCSTVCAMRAHCVIGRVSVSIALFPVTTYS